MTLSGLSAGIVAAPGREGSSSHSSTMMSGALSIALCNGPLAVPSDLSPFAFGGVATTSNASACSLPLSSTLLIRKADRLQFWGGVVSPFIPLPGKLATTLTPGVLSWFRPSEERLTPKKNSTESGENICRAKSKPTVGSAEPSPTSILFVAILVTYIPVMSVC